MAYKSTDLPDKVVVVLTYPYIFELDDKGEFVLDEFGRKKPRKFKYVFPRLRNRDAQIDDQERVLGDGKKFTPVQKLAKLLLEDPEGFDDFPMGDQPLAERVVAFFDNEKLREFAEDALTGRVNAVYPSQTFRAG